MEMGRVLMEYCLNAVWLVPVVAGAAWLLVRVARLRPAGEHRVWLGALAVCLLLPGLRIQTLRVETAVSNSDLQPPPLSAQPASAQLAVLPVSLAEIEPMTVKPRGLASPAEDNQAGRRWLLRLRPIPLPTRIVRWFAWIYAGAMGFAGFRMARGWWAALRLVREAIPYATSEAEDALLQELAAEFLVEVPRVLSSERVQSPVVVGIWRTALLLPVSFARCAEAERRAALCHELAHVQRRDCLVHAGVQALMLPLVWHPVAHLVGRRIARTREMVCDEMAAAAMSSGAGGLTYARCLLNLARTMVGQEAEPLPGLGLGLFRANKLEERVMRLTETKRVLTARETFVRRVGGVAIAGVVLVAGAMVHVAPVVAQQSAPLAPAAPLVPLAQITEIAPVPPSSADAPQAAPTPRPAPQPAAALAPDMIGLGTSGSDVLFDGAPGGVFQNEHGEHVMMKDGDHIHQWVGADGQPYEVRDAQVAPYTRQQEREAEAEYKRKMARAQAQIDKLQKKLNSPEFKAGLDKISSKASAEAMAKAEAALATATAQFNSPEFKAQMAHLNSPQFKAQLDALQAQVARLDGKVFQDQLDSLTSAEVGAKLAEAERQAALVDTPEMEQRLNDAAKRMDEAAARLEAATKALAEAQKRLQQTPAK